MSDMVCEIDVVEIAVNPRMGLFSYSMQSIHQLMQLSISMEKKLNSKLCTRFLLMPNMM
jgi:hypothetical protein